MMHLKAQLLFSWRLMALTGAALLLFAPGGLDAQVPNSPVLNITANLSTNNIDMGGLVDDQQLHAPADYNDFTPGAVGSSYQDSTFGCTVTRISDGKSYCNSGSWHYYSTISPVNSADSLIIMQLQPSAQCGYPAPRYIADTNGQVVVSPVNFPISLTGNIPWDNFDPNVFYYTFGTTLYKGTVNPASGTVSNSALGSFPEYQTVTIPDDEDISYDNDHLWLVGDGSTTNGQAFLITLTPTSPEAHTGCTKVAVVSIGAQQVNWHKIQITPSNKMAVLNLNTQLLNLYNTDGTLFKSLTAIGHVDFGYDADGTTEVAVGSFYHGTAQNGCASGWGIGVLNLDTGLVLRCLLDNISHENTLHVSYRDSTPRGPGWVLLSMERSVECSTNETGPDLSCLNGNTNWFPYSGEEIIARIDGSQVRRLAHHYSRSSVSYWAQPLGAISKDGGVVVFDSDFNDFNGGITTSSGTNYADTYLIRLLQNLSPPVVTANVVLSWETHWIGFALECATNLPTTNWTTVGFSSAIINGQNTVICPVSDKAVFYRLHHP